MVNYWLIGMDYTKYDFAKLEAEYKDNGKEILWKVPGSPEFNKDGQWIKKGLAKQIKCSDIMFFYVFNIESQSGNDSARILLRGEVTQEPQPMELQKIYRSCNTESLCNSSLGIGLSIGNIKTLKKDELENDNYYSREMLTQEYQQLQPQGKRWPNKQYGNLKQSLIDALENSFKQSGDKRDFLTLINHFNRKCFFLDKIGSKNDHKTFKVKKSGTDYFEIHHFIPQSTAKVINDPYFSWNVVDNIENKIALCPCCHRRIHLGGAQDVYEMLSIIYHEKKDLPFMKNISEYIGTDDFLTWLNDFYAANCQNKKELYEGII